MSLARRNGRFLRSCAGVVAVAFLSLIVCLASLSPDKLFVSLSSQNRVNSLIRAIALIDGESHAEDARLAALRSLVSSVADCAWVFSEIWFVTASGVIIRENYFASRHEFSVHGVDTVSRE